MTEPQTTNQRQTRTTSCKLETAFSTEKLEREREEYLRYRRNSIRVMNNIGSFSQTILHRCRLLRLGLSFEFPARPRVALPAAELERVWVRTEWELMDERLRNPVPGMELACIRHRYRSRKRALASIRGRSGGRTGPTVTSGCLLDSFIRCFIAYLLART